MGIFLKLDGIESDASDANHEGSKGWIACDSFTGGTNRPMYLETGGGTMRETSDADLHEIGLRMKMHKGSPKVFMASLMGPCKNATIHVTRSSDTAGTNNYLEIELTDVYVTGYSVDVADGDVPFESITLNYTKIENKYKPNASDGKPGSPVPCGFDKKTGKKT
jgi:type VI protein secretion system component Hcp